MLAADKLRQEMTNNPAFRKEDLINKIVVLIKSYGHAKFICDKHIRRTCVHNSDNVIAMSDEYTAIQYAKSEGFIVSYDYNSYGVRYIVFSI